MSGPEEVKRGHQIPLELELQVLVSYQAWVLCKSKYSQPLCHLSGTHKQLCVVLDIEPRTLCIWTGVPLLSYILSSPEKKYFKISLHVWMFFCICVCILCACLVPSETRRGHQITWS